MRTPKNGWIARGIVFIFAAVLLSVSFAAYKHAVPTGMVKYISFEHELCRLLVRAERDNFRIGVTAEDGGVMPDPPQEIGEVPPSPRAVVTSYRLALIQRSLIEPNRLVLDLSPVLNL